MFYCLAYIKTIKKKHYFVNEKKKIEKDALSRIVKHYDTVVTVL